MVICAEEFGGIGCSREIYLLDKVVYYYSLILSSSQWGSSWILSKCKRFETGMLCFALVICVVHECLVS